VAEMNHPRARIAIQTIPAMTPEQFQGLVRTARQRLDTQLSGTGLRCVGKPVIEEGHDPKQIYVSWKVFSGLVPNQEEDYA
jgi:hypothetical protein